MEKIETARGLMIGQLRDVYNAEKQLNDRLVNLIEEVADDTLKKAIKKYVGQNEDQIMRLKQMFSELYIYGSGQKCDTMRAMLKTFDEQTKRCSNGGIFDAGLIDNLQHIIHYKIAGYSSICSYAKMLQFWHIANTMQVSLEEEECMNRILSVLSRETINPKTMGVEVA